MMKQPAIVLITCDELRRDTLSCYGNQAIQTPHIDSLLETGVSFDNCYTPSPWCLPARCAILTGRYPHKNGAYSNFRKCPLDKGVPNLFQRLGQGGYRTAVVGKCHFAPVPYGDTRPELTQEYDLRDYYKSLGIDDLILEDDKQVSVWFYDDYSRELEQAGYLKAYRDCVWNGEYQKVFPFPGPAEWHPDAWVGQKAADYIRSRKGEAQTFAWISFSGPHYPFDAPREYKARVDETKLRPRIQREGELAGEDRIHHKSYYGGGNIDGAGPAKDHACKNYGEAYWKRLLISYNANVALIDDQVGEILQAVRETWGENALVIFTADHGEMLGDHGLWGKHNCGYDPVWRIPMIVRFPGQTQGERTRALSSSLDILPTCLEAAGVPAAEEADGKSFRQRLKGEGLAYAFAEGEGFLAATDGRLKYIHIQQGADQYRELLDTKTDPHEFENRIDWPEYAGELARLREKVIEHLLPSVLP